MTIHQCLIEIDSQSIATQLAHEDRFSRFQTELAVYLSQAGDPSAHVSVTTLDAAEPAGKHRAEITTVVDAPQVSAAITQALDNLGLTVTQTRKYQGFDIFPAPQQLSVSGEWTLDVHIFRLDRNPVASKDFHAANTYRTRSDAVDAAFSWARDIIDGKRPDLSVDDL